MSLILSAVGAFLLSWLCCNLLQRNAVAWHLVDVPNARSSHAHPTPRGGGIGIVVGFVAGFVAHASTLQSLDADVLLIVSSLLLAVAGFVDDRFSLAVLPRMLIQAACAIVVAVFVGAQWLSSPAGVLLIALTTIYLMWLINLYNFMDGIDGIAAIEAITVLLSVIALSWSRTAAIENPGFVILMAACAGFLLLNWSPAKLFMGDAGSTFLGLMLAGWSIGSQSVPWVCWIILLAAFIGDASTTLLIRLARGERVYQAHRSHLYQRLALKWGSHGKVCLLIVVVNALWLLPLAFVASRVQDNLLFLAGLVVAAYLPIILVVYNMARNDGCGVGKISIESQPRE